MSHINGDGTRLISGSADRTLKLWDASTGEELWTLKGSAPVVKVTFSLDGLRFCAGLSDGAIILGDATPSEQADAAEERLRREHPFTLRFLGKSEMSLATRPSRKRLTRSLVFEQVEHRRLMAADVAAIQSAPEVSDDAQFMIELVNRARSNPLAEAQRQGIDLNQGLAAGSITDSPKQPLAPNQHLVDAALAHSLDMLANNYFSHTGLDGSSPSTRVRDAGYSTGAAENIALNYASGRKLVDVIAASHDMLFRSAGHRQNLLSGYMSDIGIGNSTGDWTYDNGNAYLSAMTTQTFGRDSNAPAAITGVAYTDSIVDDDFYTPGEGMASVMIEAVSTTGVRYTTHTGPSGGYTLQLPAGRYSVRAFDNVAKTIAILGNVEIGNTNVKLDLLPQQFTSAGGTDLPPIASPPSSRNLDCDVNSDGAVSASDALAIINHLNNPKAEYTSQLDVNRDALISSLDALIIINQLNAATVTSTDLVARELDAIVTEDPRLVQLIDQAKKDVQKRFPADRDLVVESAKAVTWSNSGLGLGKFMSAQVLTPGYQIVLRYGTALIEYRATAAGPVQWAGWTNVSDYLAEEDGFCCPWDIDAPCLEALDKALDAVTVDYIHSSKV